MARRLPPTCFVAFAFAAVTVSRIQLRCVVLLAAIGIVAACSNESQSGPGGSGKNADKHHTAAGSVSIGGTGYRPGPLGTTGSVAGVVRLSGTAPADTAPTSTGEPQCDVSSEADNDDHPQSATVVWIADPKTGKALPTDKLVEINVDHCQIDPRMRPMVVGSGVNIFNDDRLIHRLVFRRSGTDDTLAVMPFFNEGQIVASDKLARQTGVVEVQCAEHPWMRTYLFVFDHPYFAVASDDGNFRIDSLAPGTYTLMVWHEGAAKPAEKTIRVSAGGVSKADLSLKLGSR
jgi:hypothetical protein